MGNLLLTSRVYFNKYYPYLLILLCTFLFFWKVFLVNQVLLPADILAGPNYPVKNPITTDSVSFSYPMKHVVISSLKKGEMPLWNKYILFGTPLLANFQSGVFSITNIFYFLTDFNSAWNFQIISQHLFAAIFMFLLLCHWKVTKFGSLMGSIAFAFGGFNIIWSEWNSHALTASFIPLIILFTDKLIQERKVLWGVILSIIIALQIFAGYPQIVLYTIPAIFLFVLIRDFRKFFLVSVFILCGFLLAAPQLLPGYELLKLSQRDIEVIPKEWAFLTPRQVITFIAPDFYGNHATYNFWGDKNYTSHIGFVGVISLLLALIGLIINVKRKLNYKIILFLSLLAFISLVMSFQNPLSLFLWEQNIFGLKAGASYRILVLFSVAISALSGFGFDYLNRTFQFRKNLVPFVGVGMLLFVFWLYAFALHNNIAIRNLVLPTCIFIGAIFIFWKIKLKVALIIFLVLELFYFGWKFTPFVPRDIIFPISENIKYLKNRNEEFRIVGGEDIPVDTNMVYEIEMASGYDAQYPARTAKYLGVLNSGDIDAKGQDRYGLVTNTKSRLLDIGNVKYFIVDYENKQSLLLRNKNYLPRTFYVDDFVVEKEDEEIFNRLFDPKFDIRKQIVLDSDLELKPGEKLYFRSDTYYPGWKAYVNGKETKIYRANYNFRAIITPSGENEVIMKYEPESFYTGLKIAVASLFILGIIVWVHELCKKRFFSYFF